MFGEIYNFNTEKVHITFYQVVELANRINIINFFVIHFCQNVTHAVAHRVIAPLFNLKF